MSSGTTSTSVPTTSFEVSPGSLPYTPDRTARGFRVLTGAGSVTVTLTGNQGGVTMTSLEPGDFEMVQFTGVTAFTGVSLIRVYY